MSAIDSSTPIRTATLRRSGAAQSNSLFALILVAPCLLLSVTVIGYPIFDVIRMSVFDVSRIGIVREFAGFGNFIKTFSDPVFVQACWQTLVWTVAVVGGTMLVSIPIALILNEDFYGRTIARTIVLLPWAISLAMTAVVWRYVVNGDFGTLNMTLSALGLPFDGYPWLADARMAFILEILVGILVSVPFTVTILLGGLTSIPETLYEASAIDGASPLHSLRYITMPLLWPFMQIAIVLNVIYVFNSFPIIWIMTNGGPSNRTDILITYIYKQAFAFGKLGNAAAGSVVMFAMLLVFAVIYLYLTKARGAQDDV